MHLISWNRFQLFCYTRICWAIWENFNNKKMSSSAESGANGTGTGLNGGWRAFLARCRRIGRPTGQVSEFKLWNLQVLRFFIEIKAYCFLKSWLVLKLKVFIWGFSFRFVLFWATRAEIKTKLAQITSKIAVWCLS